MDKTNRVQETWDELGYQVRPLGFWAFVRTEPLPQKTAGGIIWLVPKLTTFYGELPHMQLVKAVVCSVGPASQELIRPGDRVIFQRLHFARHLQMQDGTFFGWINPEQIAGFPMEDEEDDIRRGCSVERMSLTGS